MTFHTFESLGLTGPQIVIHDNATPSGATLQGTGRILEGGNQQSYNYQPASQIIIRGDLTWFKDGWQGNHQFQTGIFAAPRNTYDQTTNYVNDGFVLEEQRLRVSGDVGSGTIPFHRRYQYPIELTTRSARDRDIGIYIQDTWRPHTRLTINGGVRADFVRRYDKVFDITRQSSTEVAPRFGFSYQLTQGRAHHPPRQRRPRPRAGDGPRRHHAVRRQRSGRAAGRVRRQRGRHLREAWWTRPHAPPRLPTTSSPTASASPSSTSTSSASAASSAGSSVSTSPASGVPTRTTGRGSTSTASTPRVRTSRSAASARSIRIAASFSSSRTTRGARSNYRALEVTFAKNMSHRFQFLGGFNRQWQEFGGTWNPTDPARFIQPNAFPSDALLYMPRGNNEENSLPITTGTTVHTYGPTWQKYSARFGGTYLLPWNMTLGRQLHDPGRSVVWPDRRSAAGWRSAARGVRADVHPAPNGTTQSNPLSTRMRFVYPTRGEGQVQAPAIQTLGVTLNKSFRFAQQREFVAGVSIFNLLNAGNYSQYNYNGANEVFNTANYLQLRNQQPARAAQLTLLMRF